MATVTNATAQRSWRARHREAYRTYHREWQRKERARLRFARWLLEWREVTNSVECYTIWR